MTIANQIKKDLITVLKKRRIPAAKLSLEHPTEESHGDYATNIALIVFSRLKKATPATEILTPLDLANQIVNAWRSAGLPDYLGKIEVVAPGFINLWLSQEYLGTGLVGAIRQKNRFGGSQMGRGKTVVVDYSSPNIAKPFGIGHLRSTIIGQAIYNLYRFTGWRTIGDNHLGDWGTQFGKLMVAIKKWHQGKTAGLTIEKLEKLYVKFHAEVEKNPTLEEEGRLWFKRLEDNDLEAKKIWQACIGISLKEFDRVYQALGVKIDYALGESFYIDKMAAVIALAKRKNLAKKSEGALVIELADMPPLILSKTDQATTYATRDLATIAFRKKRWQPDLYIYEVGADQKLHFQQLFLAAEKLGYGQPTHFAHIAHGLIRWEHGKFSTRQGKTIHLEKILKEAIVRARKVIKASETDRGLSTRQQETIAQEVGIGAVKYFDLMHHYSTDIIFDWEKMFVLEGNSGPYLQYTYARCRSVLRRAGKLNFQFSIFNFQLNSEELSLLRTLYRFPEVVAEAARNFSPNLVCNYLFDSAQKYNLFYQKWPILKAESKKLMAFRLELTAATGQIIKNGLTLLGIATPERM